MHPGSQSVTHLYYLNYETKEPNVVLAMLAAAKLAFQMASLKKDITKHKRMSKVTTKHVKLAIKATYSIKMYIFCLKRKKNLV